MSLDNRQSEDPEYGETLPLQRQKQKEKESCKIPVCERKFKARCVIGLVLICCLIGVWYAVYWGIVGGDGVTATVYRRDPCASAKYGCCEIYSECKMKSDHIDYEKRRIKPFEIKSNDNLYSNCPSLETLINKYNQHYGNMTTDCGSYGCCPGLNIGCDKTIRQSFRIGNNEGTKDLLHENSKIINMKIPKIDQRGSNCMLKPVLIYNLIKSYSIGYPSHDNCGMPCQIVSFVIVACIILWLLGVL